jgi:hypothetical protein
LAHRRDEIRRSGNFSAVERSAEVKAAKVDESHSLRQFPDATKNLPVPYVLSVLNFDPIFARVSGARWTSNQRLNLL